MPVYRLFRDNPATGADLSAPVPSIQVSFADRILIRLQTLFLKIEFAFDLAQHFIVDAPSVA